MLEANRRPHLTAAGGFNGRGGGGLGGAGRPGLALPLGRPRGFARAATTAQLRSGLRPREPPRTGPAGSEGRVKTSGRDRHNPCCPKNLKYLRNRLQTGEAERVFFHPSFWPGSPPACQGQQTYPWKWRSRRQKHYY
ncbi:Solute Carrier Family 52, Riboflavin Transporter, Member 3 [Manis pentadactyla]|nr:Solute Carrier Family 52, Riboflavin Transporter, Member 3 [Manis pentadactyla]